MSSTKVGRLLKLFLAALVVEKLTMGFPGNTRFIAVFLAVYVADNLFGGKRHVRSLFLEDVVVGLLVYAFLGYVAYWLDMELSIHTAKHAGPLVPALLWAVLDKAWKP